jgi:asparagine synthase (glutamine-hydrolysing)
MSNLFIRGPANRSTGAGDDGELANVCGITGYTHGGCAFDPGVIRTATHSLVHRGPDDQGTYESECISLGAVRLKIIDLTAGGQPLFSEDRDTVLVFNGEIYNHRELRAELEGLGHRFSSQSDTEVLLRSFLQWDKDCFHRLRGMFAAAFWKESERRLVLVRDRIGIKPLYICRRGRNIYFGSELKSLFCHPEIPRQMDLAALQHYLALNYVPGPRTMVEGIEKLPPGHLLEWREGKVQIEPYWQLRFSKKRWTEESAEETLDHLMKESVRDHLISDVPLGVWLSGGVDSSALLSYAREASPSRLKTFSICFKGKSFDERRYIREIAAKYETEHYELDLNPSLDLPSAIEELSYYSDEPFADAGAVPVWFLSILSRKKVTVALSGEGSDELFGGYLTYRADHLASYARSVPRFMRRGLVSLLRFWPVSDEKISLEYKVKRFMEGSLLPADDAHTYWNGTFSQKEQVKLLSKRTAASVKDMFGDDLPCPLTEGLLSRYLAFDQRYYLPDDLLQKVDRMSMAHSLEVRPPYLDHRIVEFAASLPDEFKVRGRRQKVILKNLMKGKLPSSILRRPKIGLDIPTHEWLRGPLRPLLLDTLSREAIEETGLFRVGGIERLIDDHMSRRANLGFHLWGLLILFLWIKQWNIQTQPTQAVMEAEGESVFKIA